MIALLALLLAQATPVRVLTLQEAQRVAQERQPQLRAARASTQAAEGRVEQSRAPLLPQLSATGGYERTTANYIFRPGGIIRTGVIDSSWSSVNYFNSSVTLSQLLWDFGQTSDRWRSTHASARATAQQILLQTRTAFFSAVAFKELLSVARETLANQHNHLVQIEGFVQAGTRPLIDLSQARADYANAEVQVINAGNAYQRSKVLLNQVMGVEGPIDYDVANEALPSEAGEDGALGPLLEKAPAARPEIAYPTDQCKAQQLLLQPARGAYGPSIAVGAGILQGTATGTNSAGWDAAARVSFTWNLFQGLLTNGMVHEAEANIGYAVPQLELPPQQGRVDVDPALLATRAAKR